MTALAKPRRRKDAGIGARLRELRLQQGLSQKDVAARIGCHPSFLSRVESGNYDPTIGTILRYCDAIGARIHIGIAERTDTGQDERSGP